MTLAHPDQELALPKYLSPEHLKTSLSGPPHTAASRLRLFPWERSGENFHANTPQDLLQNQRHGYALRATTPPFGHPSGGGEFPITRPERRGLSRTRSGLVESGASEK